MSEQYGKLREGFKFFQRQDTKRLIFSLLQTFSIKPYPLSNGLQKVRTFYPSTHTFFHCPSCGRKLSEEQGSLKKMDLVFLIQIKYIKN
jgi:hypothetical protein